MEELLQYVYYEGISWQELVARLFLMACCVLVIRWLIRWFGGIQS